MATRTAQTGTWNTNGAWVGGVQPTAADDVIVPSGVTLTMPAASGPVCRSVTVQSGATWAWPTGSAAALSVGDGTAGVGSVAISISSGATTTHGGNATISLVSTSGTQQTISTGGKTLTGVAITVNGTGSSYLLSGALTIGGAFTMTAGTVDTAGYSVTSSQIVTNGAVAKTLTLGSTVWTVTSTNTPISWSGSNFTLNAGTSTIKTTPAVNAAQWVTASGTPYNVESNVAGNFLTGGLTCENFSYTGAANQTSILQMSANLVCRSSLTLTGNSDVNRPSVISPTAGTTRGVFASTYNISGGVDFRDIMLVPPAGSVIASDSFNRADGALGNTDSATGGTTKTWTTDTGGWSVTGNQGTRGGGAGDYYATFDAGTQDVEVRAVINGGFAGLVARYDANGWVRVYADAGGALYVAVKSGGSIVQSNTGAGPIAWGDTVALTVIGNGFAVLKNGVMVYANVRTDMPTGTGVGVYALQSSALFDDFRVSNVSNVAASSGLVGDQQDNAGIAFTTPATQTRDSTSGQAWSVAARWTSRVPLPQDDVIVNASSGSISATDVLILGRNVNFTGYTGTLTRTSTSSPYQIYGSLTLGSGMNMGANPNTMYVEYRGRGPHTVTCNGVQHFPATSNQRIDMYGFGGSLTATDNLALITSASGTPSLNLYAGTLDLGSGLTHQTGTVATSGAIQRTMNFGTSTVNLTATNATTIISATGSNFSFNASQATFNIANASGLTRTVTASGQTIGTLNYTVADSPGLLSFSASVTVLNLNAAANRGIVVTQGQTLTVRNWSGSGQNNGCQRMTGVAQDASGNTISIPNSAALQVNNDICVDVQLRLPSWSSPPRQAYYSKINTGLTLGCYLRHESNGTLNFAVAGSSGSSSASTGTVFGPGDLGWIRVTRVKTTGETKFWTSTDGSSWTQLGTAVTIAANANVGTSTDPVYIGSRQTANDNMTVGDIHRVRLYSDAVGSGTTNLQLDANFAAKTFGADTFTESSANAATVTLGPQLVTGDGRLAVRSSVAGSPAYLDLSIGSAPPVTDWMVVKDIWSRAAHKFYAGPNSVNVSGNTAVLFANRTTEPYPWQSKTAGPSSASVVFDVQATAGNLLIVSVWTNGSTTNIAIDQPGWTKIAHQTGNASATFWKVADGSETQATFTFTGTATTQNATFVELVGLGNNPSVNTIGSNTATSTTGPYNLLSSAGSSSPAVPSWAHGLIHFNGTRASSVAVTDGFHESIAPTIATIGSVFGKPFLVGSTAINPSYQWTTSRVPYSYMVEAVHGNLAASTVHGLLIADPIWF